MTSDTDHNDVSLRVGNQMLVGWTDVAVSAGIDRCPRSFKLSMTERYLDEFAAVSVKPGDVCEIFIGADRVLTGYVDRVAPAIELKQHLITVTGRGQCADLVDCSARWPSNQISNVTLISLAQKLADPYGIAVEGVGDLLEPVPQFNIMWGETAYAIIDRVASYQGLLAYETPGGNLKISTVGTSAHASGFAEGANVERAVVNFGIDQRYSTYTVRLLSFVDPDISGVGTDIVETVVDKDMSQLKLRNGQQRDRFLYVVCESGQSSDWATAQRRGMWEAAVRAGRSYNVTLTADNWRDGAGELWTPNQLASVALPTLKLPRVSWVIADVMFRLDASGTHADLVLMPKEAFQPEPFLLGPVLRGVTTPAVAPDNPPSQQ